MKEKGKNGIIQGVALSEGSTKRDMRESSYQAYQSGKKAGIYAGQARAKAAKAMKKRGF